MPVEIYGGNPGMILGKTATALTFISLIISIAGYYLSYRNNDEKLYKVGRTGFLFASGLIAFQAVLLMWGLQTHQFQWQYVFSYSSRDLSTYYLTSTFWAGQEGTFLLWLLLGSIYGFFIIRSKDKHEPMVMSFLALVQSFVTLILIKKNPFTYIWDVNPNHFQAGVVPLDGNGLNPLLQDPWMIIHPPVLFIGYSSTAILFAFAMAALVTRDYDNWIRRVFPYALFVVLALGTGIILGGYWAYTTLGWGGYWGWDPVENSSLVPWLTSLAFLHGIIIQRRQGGMKKSNIAIALLSFMAVLWGSFLTRSGVLSDFSVHSFSETAINTYLTAFVLFFFGLSLLTFLFKTREVKSEQISEKIMTRGSFMLFGIMALVVSAVLTFFGTSAPLITGIIGQASNVSMDYYNRLNAPIAILIGLFIALSPVLSWKKESGEKLKGLTLHAGVTIVISAVAFFLGLRDIVPMLIFALFTFVVMINGEIVFNLLKRKSWGFGGYLAHVGIGLMLIGIIVSSVYDKTTKTTLPLGQAKEVLGYNMTYTGLQKGADGKEEARIDIGSASSVFTAAPKFYWSKFSQAYMRNPSVHNLWIKDLYISPIQIIPPEELSQGATVEIKKDGQAYFEDYVIKFNGYEMNQHEMGGAQMHIAALLNISIDGKTHLVKPAVELVNNERKSIAAQLPGTNRNIIIRNISVEDKSIVLEIDNPVNTENASVGRELLAVEVTEKPLINFLWFGTYIMIAGIFVAIVNRVKIKRF